MKRHVNEFLKTKFANSGRAAGPGILHDRYDEDSGLEYRGGSVRVRLPSDNLSKEELEKLNGEVKIYEERINRRHGNKRSV